jgi:hypothetical protein
VCSSDLYFNAEGIQGEKVAFSGLAKSMKSFQQGIIVVKVKEFIQNMEIQITGNNVEVTLRDIVKMVSTSVKSQPYYCESMKLFIAILTAVKFINKSITQPDFKFSTGGILGMFSKLSGLQKSFVACFSQTPVGDPVATNYFKFNTDAFTTTAAAAAAGGSKSMRRNRRHRNRRNKTHRGRGRSHKRASKSHKRA